MQTIVRTIISNGRVLRTLVSLLLFVTLSSLVLAQGQDECVDPLWTSAPEDLQVDLSSSVIRFPGDRISGNVSIDQLDIPEYLRDYLREDPRLGLFIQIDIQPRDVATFELSGTPTLTHRVGLSRIEGGHYNFGFQVIGRRPGNVQFLFGWKFKVLTEGACSVAINGVYAGCWIGGQLNGGCVCATFAAMPNPGNWACRIHPLTFRAAWALWGCPGPSPY